MSLTAKGSIVVIAEATPGPGAPVHCSPRHQIPPPSDATAFMAGLRWESGSDITEWLAEQDVSTAKVCAHVGLEWNSRAQAKKYPPNPSVQLLLHFQSFWDASSLISPLK